MRWVLIIYLISSKFIDDPDVCKSRADSRLAPNQWETSLQSNVVCHWMGAHMESALKSVRNHKLWQSIFSSIIISCFLHRTIEFRYNTEWYIMVLHTHHCTPQNICELALLRKSKFCQIMSTMADDGLAAKGPWSWPTSPRIFRHIPSLCEQNILKRC